MAKQEQGQGSTAAKKYIPVNSPEEIYQVYKSYSQLTGVPVAKALRDGLQEYADVCLSVRMETLTAQIKAGKGVLHAAVKQQPAAEVAQHSN